MGRFSIAVGGHVAVLALLVAPIGLAESHDQDRPAGVLAPDVTTLPALAPDAATRPIVAVVSEPGATAHLDLDGVASPALLEKAVLGAAKKVEAPKPPVARLDPALAALRDRVRWTLAAYSHQMLNTNDHTPADILHLCVAYGCDAQIQHGAATINAFGGLCWNYPCGGYQLLTVANNHIGARIGYGYQSQPAQLLAALAISRAPAEYAIHAGQKQGTVADLVETEKRACRSGSDQALRLFGLAYYVPHAETWKNSLDQPWSIDRMVEEELEQTRTGEPYDEIQQLLALSCAVSRDANGKHPAESPIGRAAKFVEEHQEYMLKVQNGDGSWNAMYLSGHGTTNDALGQLRATAHIAQWLAFSLPKQDLGDRRMARSIEYLNSLLANQASQWQVAALSNRAMESVFYGISALAIYDDREFKPFDSTTPSAAGASAPPVDETAK